eukprot:194261-Pleurochrysis_carterae.AAC.2
MDNSANNENDENTTADQKSTHAPTPGAARPHNHQQRTIVDAFDHSHVAAINIALSDLFFLW